MDKPNIQLELNLSGSPQVSEEEWAEISRRLRDDLMELEVQSVEPATEEAPEGSMAGNVLDWTKLLVTIPASGIIGLMGPLITAIQSYVTRKKDVSVTLELAGDKLVISGAGPYSKEQQKVIDLWMSRHKGILLPNE